MPDGRCTKKVDTKLCHGRPKRWLPGLIMNGLCLKTIIKYYESLVFSILKGYFIFYLFVDFFYDLAVLIVLAGPIDEDRRSIDIHAHSYLGCGN